MKKLLLLVIFVFGISFIVNERVLAQTTDSNNIQIEPYAICEPSVCIEDPGGGGGEHSETIRLGGFQSTTTFGVDFPTENYIYYFNFTAPSSGYYQIDTSSSGGTSLNVELYHYSTLIALGTTGHYIKAIGSYADNDNIDSNDIEFYLTGGYYTIKITNIAAISISGRIYRDDDNTILHPKSFQGETTSIINYSDDIDYYKFYNTNIVYDLYTYNSNVDTKAELYSCDDAECSTLNQITSNDDYEYYIPDSSVGSEKLSSIEGMDRYDFGFRIDLGAYNDTYNKPFMLRVHHYNYSSTGSYTVHIARRLYGSITIDEQDIYNDPNSITYNSVGAVWESSVLFGIPLYNDDAGFEADETPLIYSSTEGDDHPYLIRRLYIWDKDVIKSIYHTALFYYDTLKNQADKKEATVNTVIETGSILISVTFPGGGTFLTRVAVTVATHFLSDFIKSQLEDMLYNSENLMDLSHLVGSLASASEVREFVMYQFTELGTHYTKYYDTGSDIFSGTWHYYGYATWDTVNLNYANKLYEDIGEFGGTLSLIYNEENDLVYLNTIVTSLLLNGDNQ